MIVPTIFHEFMICRDQETSEMKQAIGETINLISADSYSIDSEQRIT